MNDGDRWARVVWDYMLMHQALRKSDAIVVLGSNDTRVAERAAELYREGWAPLVIFSGGNGKGSQFARSEAEEFAAIGEAAGIPRSAMLLEARSQNTGENIGFTQALLGERGMILSSAVFVQKPYMERRTYATVRKQWPDLEVVVTSPKLSFAEYPSEKHHTKYWIDTMVGDLQRIKEYPKRGFQIEQDIPVDVWTAYEALVKLGYTKYVMKTV